MTDALTRLPDAELEVMQALWALDAYPCLLYTSRCV